MTKTKYQKVLKQIELANIYKNVWEITESGLYYTINNNYQINKLSGYVEEIGENASNSYIPEWVWEIQRFLLDIKK